MSIINASSKEHTLRRLSSVMHTLGTVAHTLDELENETDVEFRWELLCLVEDIIDVATYVTVRSRDIAWLHTPLPQDQDLD